MEDSIPPCINKHNTPQHQLQCNKENRSLPIFPSAKQPEKMSSNHPFSHLVSGISSYNGNVLMAAVISLLLVILFVLLLHIYAKWFLAQSRHRRQVLRPDRFTHFRSFPFESTDFGDSPSKGLDPSSISSIPLFVYRKEEHLKQNLECVICLSPFEENELGRNLIKCGHCFHVECVDRWLHSHSNCPICRAPVVILAENGIDAGENGEVGVNVIDGDSRLQVVTNLSDFDNRNLNLEQKKDDSISASSSSSSSSSIGCSLKRMLSRNRSEGKVFPSSDDAQLNV